MSRSLFALIFTAIMLLLLGVTLWQIQREANQWLERRAIASQQAQFVNDPETIQLVLPFAPSEPIQDLIGFQWPAYLIAEFIAPVPQIASDNRIPPQLTVRSYVALSATVGIYWFLIALWIHLRIIKATKPKHSNWSRILLWMVTLPTLLLFILTFVKDALPGGWPEGPQGA